MRKSLVCLVVGLVLFLHVGVSHAAEEKYYGPQLKVLSAKVDFNTGILSIVGENFEGWGNKKPVVFLGDDQLVIDHSTSSEIEAFLPSAIEPGSYLLTVSYGKFFSRYGFDLFEVAVGAVGPAGPPGEPGPNGDWSEITNIPSGFADNTDDGYKSKTELTDLLDDNYVRNQTGTTQSAGFRISGSGRVGSSYVDGSIAVYNGAARVVSCPSGMNYVETNLCIDASARSAQYYWVEAVSVCRRSGYHMCTYAELDQVLCHENLYSVVYNPNGRWIGNFVGDDTVICGNTDITGTGCQSNFDGHCNKNTSSPGRQYWCCLSLGNTQ